MDQLTTAQAAALLGVDESTVRHLIRDGRLRAITKHGRDWVIERAAVEDYQQRRRARRRKTTTVTTKTTQPTGLPTAQPNGLFFTPSYKRLAAAFGIKGEVICISRNDGDGAFYDLWRTDQDAFELAIGLQHRKEYAGMEWMVACVVDHADQEVCAGLYHIEGWEQTKPGTRDPILKKDVSASHPYHYRVRLSRYMGFLFGHPVALEWGASMRTFCMKQDVRMHLLPGPKVPFTLPPVLGGSVDEAQESGSQQWLNAESANWLKQSWDLHGPVEWQADLIAGPKGTPKAAAQQNLNNIMRGVAGHLMPEEVKAELRRRGLHVPPPTGDWPSAPPGYTPPTE